MVQFVLDLIGCGKKGENTHHKMKMNWLQTYRAVTPCISFQRLILEREVKDLVELRLNDFSILDQISSQLLPQGLQWPYNEDLIIEWKNKSNENKKIYCYSVYQKA